MGSDRFSEFSSSGQQKLVYQKVFVCDVEDLSDSWDLDHLNDPAVEKRSERSVCARNSEWPLSRAGEERGNV